MDTVIVSNGQFYSHYPKNIAKGTVDAEAVLIRLDSEWDNLTVRIHWLNVASGVEKVVLLERDQPNTIPWEVLADLGELRMGLVGLDGETVIKPTIWLTYGYITDGVDPEAGEDPQPPTPSWEQQMVEQATQANQAAQAAQKASEEAAKSVASAGPYAQAAKDAAEAAKESQEAADTSAKHAANAKVAAERAAEMAGNTQSEAAQSAQAAANSAQAAERAKQEAQNAASALPAPSQEFAGMVPMVNQEGNGYIFGEAGGAGAGGELLLAEYIHRGNQEIHFTSFDWKTGIGECTEPHGLTEPKKVLIVPNNWWDGTKYVGAGVIHIPIEWMVYTGTSIYVVPVDETRVKITGADKTTMIPVNTEDVSNTNLDATKFHVEIPIGFSIKELPVDCTSIRVFAFGITGTLCYRYISLYTDRTYGGARIWPEGFLTPPATGLSKAKYALVFWYDICAEAVPAGAVFVMNNLYKAQRKGYPYWVGDRTAEHLVTNYGSGGDNRAEIFTGLLIENVNACYANHTVFRIYAKAVKQE